MCTENDISTCTQCQATYVLDNNDCRDCSDPEYSNDNCPESIELTFQPFPFTDNDSVIFFDISRNPSELSPNANIFLLVYLNNFEVVYTQEGEDDVTILMDTIQVVELRDELGETLGKFTIRMFPALGTILYYKVNKFLKIKYLDPILYSEKDSDGNMINAVYLKRNPIQKEIEASESSLKRAEIEELERVTTSVTSTTQLGDTVKVGEAVAKVATTASLASIAVVVRFFVIVDILTNFLGKINVDLGPRIKSIVTNLKKLDIPSVKVIETTSPIDDGGTEVLNDWEKRKE